MPPLHLGGIVPFSHITRFVIKQQIASVLRKSTKEEVSGKTAKQRRRLRTNRSSLYMYIHVYSHVVVYCFLIFLQQTIHVHSMGYLNIHYNHCIKLICTEPGGITKY